MPAGVYPLAMMMNADIARDLAGGIRQASKALDATRDLGATLRELERVRGELLRAQAILLKMLGVAEGLAEGDEDRPGGHRYPLAPSRTSDCAYGCGCWAGPYGSGGPRGINPLGRCPKNAGGARTEMDIQSRKPARPER